MGDIDGIYGQMWQSHQQLDEARMSHHRSFPHQRKPLPTNLIQNEALVPLLPSASPITDHQTTQYYPSSPFAIQHIPETPTMPSAFHDFNTRKHSLPTQILNRHKALDPYTNHNEVNLLKFYHQLRNYGVSIEDANNYQPPMITMCSISTQTEQSTLDEKFLTRETILLGSELVSELGCLEPNIASELQECADYVREKTIQSRGQDVCSRLLPSEEVENIIVLEYVKVFLRIADTWLETRNCFGLSKQCALDKCTLKSRTLTHDYLEWMYASRKLMDSIVLALEGAVRGRMLPKKPGLLGTQSETYLPRLQPETYQRAVLQQRPKWAVPPCQPEGLGGLWGYPPIPPCHCGLNVQPIEEMDTGMEFDIDIWNPTPQPPTYLSYGVAKAHSAVELGRRMSKDILKPGSYNVERCVVTQIQKRVNILKAKSTCCRDTAPGRGYIVAFTIKHSGSNDTINQPNKDFEYDDDGESKENVQNKKDFELGRVKECSREYIQTDQDSDSQASVSDKHWQNFSPSGPKISTKKVLSNVKRRRILNHKCLTHIQQIIQELGKYDWPDDFRNVHPDSGKCLKPPITLEIIANKSKNATYETIDQFINDCRKLLSNASIYYEQHNDKNLRDKMCHIEKKLRTLLESHLEQFVCGDSKESNYYPDLRYNSSSKRRTNRATRIMTDSYVE